METVSYTHLDVYKRQTFDKSYFDFYVDAAEKNTEKSAEKA